MSEGKEGIEVQAREGKLIVTAPKGALTPEIVQTLQEHKPELLAFLAIWPGPARLETSRQPDRAAIKAERINRQFKKQGALGRSGRIRAATVRHTERLWKEGPDAGQR